MLKEIIDQIRQAEEEAGKIVEKARAGCVEIEKKPGREMAGIEKEMISGVDAEVSSFTSLEKEKTAREVEKLKRETEKLGKELKEKAASREEAALEELQKTLIELSG